jgi:outer membrane protein assembly factor BamB
MAHIRSVVVLLFSGLVHVAAAADWPQWRGPNRDGLWEEEGIVERFDRPQLDIKWRVGIGAGYSGPTVADGRVYVTDRIVEPQQIERVHCFNAHSGAKIWSHQYPCVYANVGYQAGPRAAVTLADGRAYALGTMGHLHCFDAATGDVVWKRDLQQQYQIRMPMWGITAAPLVVEDLVIVHIGGQDEACVVALASKDGGQRWRALNDRASYSAPILVQQAGQAVLVCWTGDSVSGLDPRSGKVYWRYPFPPTRMPIGIATPVVSEDRLFVTSFYDGSLMLRLHQDRLEVEPMWEQRGPDEKHTEAIHSIISTPLMLGDFLYGVDSYGELRCLEASTGQRVWEDQTATPRARWSTIHMVRNGDRIWLFNERGQLIIAELSPSGFREISRAQLLEPTKQQLPDRGGVCWAHPAFANRHVFARNDNELVCASLEAR